MEEPKVKVLYFGSEDSQFVNEALKEQDNIEAVYCVSDFDRVEDTIRERGIRLILFCSASSHSQALKNLCEKYRLAFGRFSNSEPREFDISFSFTIAYAHGILGWRH